jgi:hypothetical protein
VFAIFHFKAWFELRPEAPSHAVFDSLAATDESRSETGAAER